MKNNNCLFKLLKMHFPKFIFFKIGMLFTSSLLSFVSLCVENSIFVTVQARIFNIVLAIFSQYFFLLQKKVFNIKPPDDFK